MSASPLGEALIFFGFIVLEGENSHPDKQNKATCFPLQFNRYSQALSIQNPSKAMLLLMLVEMSIISQMLQLKYIVFRLKYLKFQLNYLLLQISC